MRTSPRMKNEERKYGSSPQKSRVCFSKKDWGKIKPSAFGCNFQDLKARAPTEGSRHTGQEQRIGISNEISPPIGLFWFLQPETVQIDSCLLTDCREFCYNPMPQIRMLKNITKPSFAGCVRSVLHAILSVFPSQFERKIQNYLTLLREWQQYAIDQPAFPSTVTTTWYCQ